MNHSSNEKQIVKEMQKRLNDTQKDLGIPNSQIPNEITIEYENGQTEKLDLAKKLTESNPVTDWIKRGGKFYK